MYAGALSSNPALKTKTDTRDIKGISSHGNFDSVQKSHQRPKVIF